jgi:hypothetical protein
MTHTFKLAAADLKRLIDKTQFAISTEETRYYLNGIYLHTAGTHKAPTLRAVATDGHRLAQVRAAAAGGRRAACPGIIVPRKTVGEVQRLIEDNEAEIRSSSRRARSASRSAIPVLTSKLIDGTFPDYGRVIPVGNDKELTVDKKEFEQASTGCRPSRASAGAREAVAHQRQADAFGHQPGFRQRDRGDRGRIRLRAARYRLQFPLSPRHRGAARGRSGGLEAGRSRDRRR